MYVILKTRQKFEKSIFTFVLILYFSKQNKNHLGIQPTLSKARLQYFALTKNSGNTNRVQIKPFPLATLIKFKDTAF
jgi:hypothetical protein